MSNLNVLALIVLTRAICCIAAIAGAVYLAKEGKDGWGWLVFLAIVIGSSGYTYKGE